MYSLLGQIDTFRDEFDIMIGHLPLGYLSRILYRFPHVSRMYIINDGTVARNDLLSGHKLKKA
jgi:hypothetical protein